MGLGHRVKQGRRSQNERREWRWPSLARGGGRGREGTGRVDTTMLTEVLPVGVMCKERGSGKAGFLVLAFRARQRVSPSKGSSPRRERRGFSFSLWVSKQTCQDDLVKIWSPGNLGG